MNKQLFFLLICVLFFNCSRAQEHFITRQGELTFFSYTSVENIEASNDQVLSLFYPSTNKIGVQILIRAFKFEKSLMYEHFNESYIESDLYPKAVFEGEIQNFDPNITEEQTRIIKGNFTLRDITRPVEFKAKIVKSHDYYSISGTLEVFVDDYKIKIPAILSPNIAKNIKISFNFQYTPNDN